MKVLKFNKTFVSFLNVKNDIELQDKLKSGPPCVESGPPCMD